MTPALRTVTLAALLIFTLAACGRQDKPTTAKSAAPIRELSSHDVLTARIGTLTDSLPFTGTLKPLNESLVAAKVDGNVVEVNVREGERVGKGQVLARIDRETLRQNVAEQQAQLANQQARLQLARIKLEKQRELFAKGFISKLALDEQESDFAVQAGGVKAQQAQLARAHEALDDSVVKAPIAGVVYQRNKNPGELASRNDKLFAIADLSVLEIAASLPARFASEIRQGMPARFTAEGQNGEFQAKLARINPVADSNTRNFEVYLRVDNHDGRLKAGQFAKGGIVLSEHGGDVVLPLSALNDRAGKPWVMLVQQGKLVQQPVTLMRVSEANGQAAVRGLSAGNTVIATSLIGMKAGDTVRLPAGLN
jgi:RND family efflux transporter MFP subunit